MRRAARRDANSRHLINVAEKLGMLVFDIGLPVDLLVCIHGVWFAVEIKAGKGRYTPKQLNFMADCIEHSAPFLTWRTEQDVIECAGGVAGVEG